MSSITQTRPPIRRHPEAMYVRFANLTYAVSLEIAGNFVVDFSPDDDIVGLEILWNDADRAGSEPALLAFGIFAAALVWRGYHHREHPLDKMRAAVYQKAAGFIAAAGLRLQASLAGDSGLTIQDADGGLFLCADLQYYPQRALKPAPVKEHKSPPEQWDDAIRQIRSGIHNLVETVLPGHPNAVGVAAFIDESGSLRHRASVAPGQWITWPEATPLVETHIAIIPPTGCVYPWLPEGFLPSRGAVNAAAPAVGVC